MLAQAPNQSGCWVSATTLQAKTSTQMVHNNRAKYLSSVITGRDAIHVPNQPTTSLRIEYVCLADVRVYGLFAGYSGMLPCFVGVA